MQRVAGIVGILLIAVGFTACTIEPNPVPDAPAILFDDDTTSRTFGAVDVVGLSSRTLRRLEGARPGIPEWQRILLVQIDTTAAAAAGEPIVGGGYSVFEERLRFTPQYAPVPGQAYHVRFDLREVRRLTGAPQDTIGVLDTTVVVGRN